MGAWSPEQWTTFFVGLGNLLAVIIYAVKSSAKKEKIDENLQQLGLKMEDHEHNAKRRTAKILNQECEEEPAPPEKPPPFDPQRRFPLP